MTDPNVPPHDPNAAPQPAPAAPLSQEQDVQWGSFAHLGGILGILPSLIIWLVFKDRGRFTETEARRKSGPRPIAAQIAKIVTLRTNRTCHTGRAATSHLTEASCTENRK